jgi:hypothetical protein
MALNFISCELLLIPPALTEWLPAHHLVWTILGAMDVMEPSRFEDAYRLG